MKRLTTLLPIAVLIAILAGLASDRWSAPDSGLPSFTRTQPPQFDPFVAPEGPLVLRGRVLDTAGAPVPETSVYLRSGGVPHWAYTDAEGSFELRGLFEGYTDATVLAWGFPPQTFRVAAGGPPVELTLPARTVPPPGIPDAPRADLRGRVLGSASAWGDPQGYELTLVPNDPVNQFGGPVQRRASTDAGGSFVFLDLALGGYRVTILPSWAAGGTWPDLGDATDLAHTGPDDIELELRAGAVEGRVWTPSLEPVEGALVLVADAEDPRRVWPPVVTDEAGRFRVRALPPGGYVLSIRGGEGALEVARRSRGTPRIVNRLLKRVRDFAQVKGSGMVDLESARAGLEALEVDRLGLDRNDRRLLLTITDKFGGGPVGLGTLSAAVGEEKDTLEEVVEPFLIQIGFLERTPRGRCVTARAYEYLGREPGRPADPQQALFD